MSLRLLQFISAFARGAVQKGLIVLLNTCITPVCFFERYNEVNIFSSYFSDEHIQRSPITGIPVSKVVAFR